MPTVEMADEVMLIRTEIATATANLRDALAALQVMERRLERVEVQLYEESNPMGGK